MSTNRKNIYDADRRIAEIYDQTETESKDVFLIQSLLERYAPDQTLHILEPFTGTGRILFPLVSAGHMVTGLDQSKGMLARARQKTAFLPQEHQQRLTLHEMDLVEETWPRDFDVVILGGNCLYELATPEEQEKVICEAALSLKPRGFLFLDNNHMEGNLASSWQDIGQRRKVMEGVSEDGVKLELYLETTSCDVAARLARFLRITRLIYPDGTQQENQFTQQKHPVSMQEQRQWLEKYGLEILEEYGDRDGNPYHDDALRAILWARKI